MGLLRSPRPFRRLLFGFRKRTVASRTRVCRIEPLEPRLPLASSQAPPAIHIGAVFTELTDLGAAESQGDRFEIAWTGGAPGTELRQVQISGDVDRSGDLSPLDVFFHADASIPGHGSSFPFQIVSQDGIGAVSHSVSADGLTLTLDVADWDPGEKLVFSIDVDEMQLVPNSIVDGLEFENSLLAGTFVDSLGHYEDVSGSGTFKDEYDNQIHPSIVHSPSRPWGVTLDAQLPPGSEGTVFRTAGAGFSAEQIAKEITIAGGVYHDENLNNVRDPSESGIDGVTLALFELDNGQYVDTGLRDTTSGGGFYSFTHRSPGTYRVLELDNTVPPEFSIDVGSSSPTGTPDNPNRISNIVVQGGDFSGEHKFAEAKPVTLAGHVWHDRNNDAAINDGPSTGIGVVRISIQRVGPGGVSPAFDVFTNPDGSWEVSGLAPGIYTVQEFTPATWIDGKDALGTAGGVPVGNDRFEQIDLNRSGAVGREYNFGELRPATLSGRVFSDPNRNATFEPGLGETPIPQTTVHLLDASGTRIATTVTAPDGTYSFVGLIPAVSYGVEEEQPPGFFDGEEKAGTAGGAVTANDKITGVVLASEENATGYDFGELPPAEFTGFVYGDLNNNGSMEASEPGIGGVLIELLDSGGNPTGRTTLTAPDGSYRFDNLPPGTYGVREVQQPAGFFDGTDSPGNAGGAAANPGDQITGLSLAPGQAASGYKFGELPPASIGGRVFEDDNDNGQIDPGERLIPGVTVELAKNGVLTGVTAVTGPDGSYLFTGLEPFQVYGIQETQPGGYYDGQDSAGTAGGAVLPPPGDRITGATLIQGQNAREYNFGELRPASLTGFVYGDLNNNGSMESSEPGIAGVLIELLHADGSPTGLSTRTDALGQYRFDNLAPGTYQVREAEQPVGFFDGLDSAGSNGGVAQNPGDLIGDVPLGPGDVAVDYKFGETPPSSLTGFVYGDLNNNGSMEADEPGIAGVLIELLHGDGSPTGLTTRTDALGQYRFDGLAPGTYQVREAEQPLGFYDGLDSAGSEGGVAHNPGDLITAIPIGPNVHAVDYKFGETPPSSLTGFVYGDLNNNGSMEADEPGIAGVLIELLHGDGSPTGLTTRTDALGQYRFDNLAPGTYQVREAEQPAGYFDGLDSAGSEGGVAHNPGDLITAIPLGPNVQAVAYKFGELPPGAISGFVFQDGPPITVPEGTNFATLDVGAFRDGQRTSDDTPLGGVTLRLTNGAGEPLRDGAGNFIEAVTDANGFYALVGLAPGLYSVGQVQPQGYLDGVDTPGTTGGFARNPGDEIVGVEVFAGVESGQNNFSEVVVQTGPALPLIIPPERSINFPERTPQSYSPAPLVNPPRPLAPPSGGPALFFGGGGVGALPGVSWHLSVIDAGRPRGEGFRGDALVQIAQREDDVFIAYKSHLANAQWELAPGEESDERPIALRQVQFGAPDGIPVAGDFNGDGVAEVGVFVRGQWFLDLNGNGVWDSGDLWARLGASRDRPVVGDWDGDGKIDIGIFGPEWPNDSRAVMSEPGLPDRQNNTYDAQKNVPPKPHEATAGRRLLRLTSLGAVRSDLIDHVFYYGGAGDVPVAGDWNGDGVDTIGVFNGGVWTLDDNGDGKWLPGETLVEFGAAGDTPVVGDFNGDGIDDLGVFRDGKWIIDLNGDRRVDDHDRVFQLGGLGDHPVVGDWDGNGVDDPGLYRPGGVIERPEL